MEYFDIVGHVVGYIGFSAIVIGVCALCVDLAYTSVKHLIKNLKEK